MKSIIIITDSKVKKLYGLKLSAHLNAIGISASLFSFPAGEKSKTLSTVVRLQEQMFKSGCGRDVKVIALGGGVVGDVAGFVASTYMRGVSLIQIPTTLLAMIDSSIGGKTGVNNRFGKNLIGSFYQPEETVLDVGFLETLSEKHLRNGLFEAAKIFLIRDKVMWKWFVCNLDKILARDKMAIEKVVKSAIKNKLAVVRNDEKEAGERMILNFGHTIGHALEKLSSYKLLHGYAVGLGMLVESKMSELRGNLSHGEYLEIERIICRLGVNKEELKKYDSKKIMSLIGLDKKAMQGVVHCVLLDKIGSVCRKNKQFAQPIDEKIIIKSFKCFNS